MRVGCRAIAFDRGGFPPPPALSRETAQGGGFSTLLEVNELWSCCHGGVPLRNQDPLTLSRRERGLGGFFWHVRLRWGRRRGVVR